MPVPGHAAHCPRRRSKLYRFTTKAVTFFVLSSVAVVIFIMMGDVVHSAWLIEKACEGLALAGFELVD